MSDKILISVLLGDVLRRSTKSFIEESVSEDPDKLHAFNGHPAIFDMPDLVTGVFQEVCVVRDHDRAALEEPDRLCQRVHRPGAESAAGPFGHKGSLWHIRWCKSDCPGTKDGSWRQQLCKRLGPSRFGD